MDLYALTNLVSVLSFLVCPSGTKKYCSLGLLCSLMESKLDMVEFQDIQQEEMEWRLKEEHAAVECWSQFFEHLDHLIIVYSDST